MSAKKLYEAHKKLLDECEKMYLRIWINAILSSPIPMSYEVWSELHRYLEKLE